MVDIIRRGLLGFPLILAAIAPAWLAAVEPGKPSVTALEVAAFRAIGAKHPDPAIRNEDTLAERFLGADERAILKAESLPAILTALTMPTEAAWASLDGGTLAFATAVHSRTRHIDEVFKEGLKTGATQAVILGAGLDSRAYRFHNELGNTRVFEVDFPPTQEYKKNRVRAVLGSLASNVVYVPIDFASEDLATVLKRAGYDAARRTIFVWEGVTFYIPEPAVDATLRFVATSSAPGSRIVFDYFLESAIKRSPTIAALGKRLAAMGEPFVFGLPDQDRKGFVERRGLSVVTDVGVNELRARYVPRQFFDSTTSSASFLCTAVVPARSGGRK